LETVLVNMSKKKDKFLKFDKISLFFEKNPYFSAIILGILAAIISSLIWFGLVVLTEWQVEIIAVLIGVLIGKAVLIGSGNKGGAYFQVISIILTVVSMFFSEYLISWFSSYKYYLEKGIGTLHLFLPLPTIAEMVKDSLYNNPLTLVFFGIAIWEAYKIPISMKKEPEKVIRKKDKSNN